MCHRRKFARRIDFSYRVTRRGSTFSQVINIIIQIKIKIYIQRDRNDSINQSQMGTYFSTFFHIHEKCEWEQICLFSSLLSFWWKINFAISSSAIINSYMLDLAFCYCALEEMCIFCVIYNQFISSKRKSKKWDAHYDDCTQANGEIVQAVAFAVLKRYFYRLRERKYGKEFALSFIVTPTWLTVNV